MNIDKHSVDGSVVGSVELPDSVFGVEPNTAVMHQAVKMHLANRRQGTHKAKERSEVRGGGRKPWKQKGRGTARAGTIRSPLWVGGGTIFGPRPRDYSQDMPKKMRQNARRSALSLKAQANEIVVVEDLQFSEIKTKPFAEMLKALNAGDKKTLVLLKENNDVVVRSARNIPNCQVLEARNASTYDILNNKVLLLEDGSIEILRQQLASANAAGAQGNAAPETAEEVAE